MKRTAFVFLALLVGWVGPSPAAHVEKTTDFELVSGDGSFLLVGHPCPPGTPQPHCATIPREDRPIDLKVADHNWTRIDLQVTWPDNEAYWVEVTSDSARIADNKSTSPFTGSLAVEDPFHVYVMPWPDVGKTMANVPVHVEARFHARAP